MQSRATQAFWRRYRDLPPDIRQLAKKQYRLFRLAPDHPSLMFKRVGRNKPVYSARINRDWRVLGALEGDTVAWFWIGPHDEYERLIQGL